MASKYKKFTSYLVSFIVAAYAQFLTSAALATSDDNSHRDKCIRENNTFYNHLKQSYLRGEKLKDPTEITFRKKFEELGIRYASEKLSLLSALQIGVYKNDPRDRPDSFTANINEVKWMSFVTWLKQQRPECIVAGVNRDDLDDSSSYTTYDSFSPTGLPVDYGARRVFATVYQSCEALEARYMSRSDGEIKGIASIGPHPLVRSVDIFRVINQQALVDSHYYYKMIKLFKFDHGEEQSACRPELSMRSPLIYRFGGKPWVNPHNNTFSLFKKSGSGGPHLGIDCSGFVMSSLMASGSRLARGVDLDPSLVNVISAKKLQEPHKNGMSCLDQVNANRSEYPLIEGDIVATGGHVFIIDAVSYMGRQRNPFGFLNNTATVSCDQITEKDLSFSIIQSSSTNMVGVNKIHIQDFLRSEDNGVIKFRNGLVAYAKAACHAHFGSQKFNKFDYKRFDMAVVRHSSHPACKEESLEYEGSGCAHVCVPKVHME